MMAATRAEHVAARGRRVPAGNGRNRRRSFTWQRCTRIGVQRCNCFAPPVRQRRGNRDVRATVPL